MKYFSKHLKSGVRLVSVPLVERKILNVSLFVRLDPALESKKLTGISHFLEHVLFSGGGIFKNSSDFFRHLAKHKISFNAWTYKHFMHFSMLTTPEGVSEAIRLLGLLASNPRFFKKQIDLTKKLLLKK